MKKKIIAGLLAAMMVLGLTACGGSKTTETAESGLSGKVTVYMPSPAGLADEIAAGFTAKTGVEVEVFQGTTGEILARLEAEEANPVADVVILASWTDGLSMKNDGKIMSYTPENVDKVAEGWIDEDSMLFGYSASAVGVIYNTTIIPELSADWDDLASAKLVRAWGFGQLYRYAYGFTQLFVLRKTRLFPSGAVLLSVGSRRKGRVSWRYPRTRTYRAEYMLQQCKKIFRR